MKAKVFFSREITPEKVVELFEMAEKKLEGNIAIKVHSGEEGNQNFLKPDFWKPVVSHVGGTVVECNTAYDGERNVTEKHLNLFKKHGWSVHYKVDLLDAEGPDLELEIPEGKVIQKNSVSLQRPSNGWLWWRHQTVIYWRSIFFRQGIYSWCWCTGRNLDSRP